MTSKIEKRIDQLTVLSDIKKVSNGLSLVLDELIASVPDNKRISYGRVYTIKVLSKFIFDRLNSYEEDIFQKTIDLYSYSDDHRVKGTALNIISLIGISRFEEVKAYFIDAADCEHWEIREFAQMFFRKLIQPNRENTQEFLTEYSRSKSPKIRRFVAETLRPAVENNWLYKEADFSLGILKNMYAENAAYPRTAVGNNLSDLSRKLPEVVFRIVRKLVSSGDRNSFWIAKRACRNLVKTYPLKVMDLLKVDEYHYKDRNYKRNDYTGG